MYRNQLFFIPILLACFHKASSQSAELPHEEAKLVCLYAMLVNNIEVNLDSTHYYSGKFGKELKKYITKTPTSLEYPFQRLKDSNYCDIATSTDGKLRIYSWDTWTGGSMHFFNQIIQYKDSGQIFTKIPRYGEGDPGTFCSAIYTVAIKGKTYYLAIQNRVYSNKDASQSVSVLTINNRQLLDTVRLFKTKKKMLNKIDVEFDFLSVVDRPERPLALITYDDRQKIVRIPIVNDKGQVTRRNMRYQLKDGYFTFADIEPDTIK